MGLNCAEYAETVRAFNRRLGEIPEKPSAVVLRPEAWSLRQIVGHLIDSASNNHQRFVRLQQGDLAAFPGYDAEDWIIIQKYNDCDWSGLVALWFSYNELLLHVVGRADPGKLQNVWMRPDGPKSLAWLIEDYYRHLRWHIDHFERRLAEITAG